MKKLPSDETRLRFSVRKPVRFPPTSEYWRPEYIAGTRRAASPDGLTGHAGWREMGQCQPLERLAARA